MSALEPGLYPHNRHNGRYDLTALYQVTPELAQFLTLMPGSGQSVDFASPRAVKTLNKAPLVHFHAVKNWDIPDGFLCPPVPGRTSYIRHLVDPLSETNGTTPVDVSVLNVGVGVNCIYPLIGMHEYGWRFTGSETSSETFNSTQAIVNANPGLTHAIHPHRQKDATTISDGIIYKNEQYEATLCSPPFHDSAASAHAGSGRKRRNLGQNKDDVLDFDRQQQELWCEGSEMAFVKRMIAESQAFGRQVMWFTTLVSHGENLPPPYHALADADAVKMAKKEMAQG